MNLNVMMVGFSGTGKTSYMGAMYKIFNQRGYNGFRIRATDDAHHRAFASIGRRLSEGIYPDGTDVRDFYEFELRHNNEDVLRFNWMDYRGGVLSERGNKELEQVVDQIVKADALMVFIDTPRFVSETTASVRLLTRIQHLIQNAISHMKNDCFVVSFVMTKADCVDDWAVLRKSAAWDRYFDIVNMLSENENVLGLMSFTTVGQECENVEYPFLHSMSMGLLMRIDQLAKKYNAAVKKANRYAEEGSVLNEIGTFFKKVFVDDSSKSKWDLAVEEMNKAERLYKKFEKLQTPLERIRDIIKNAVESADTNVWTF